MAFGIIMVICGSFLYIKLAMKSRSNIYILEKSYRVTKDL